MIVLASYNIKGGVGKTATAVNLAYLAAVEGSRTLVWDLDPQGAASFYFRVKPKVKKGGAGLVFGERNLSAAIKGTDYDNLDLVPADFSYRNLDLFLDEVKKSHKRFKKILKPLHGDYDFVFLDCPPSISLVSENVFRAADVLLVPTIPTTLSLRTVEQLVGFCQEQALTALRILPFFSMVDMRKNLHKLIVQASPQNKSYLDSYIPYTSEIEQMGLHRAALMSYAPNSRSSEAYRALWHEIKTRLNETPQPTPA